MLFNVPQFIQTEDKIVGPLTGKQLGWLAIGAVIALVFWSYLDTSAFIVAAIIIAAIFGALAFYRPYNQPLISLIFSSLTFVMNPKLYVWDREGEIFARKGKHLNTGSKAPTIKKDLDLEKIEEVSDILNSPVKK